MPLRHFTLVALVLTAACSSPAEIAEKTGATASATASASASGGETESTAQGSAFAYSKTLSEAGGGKLEFAYGWPKQAASEPRLAALLKQNLDRDFAETKAGWEGSYKECPADGVSCRNYAHESRYEVVADLPGYLSLSNLFYVYTGGAHGMSGMESLVWDRQAQKAMAGIDLFRSSAALGSAIGPALCTSLNAARAKKGMEPVTGDDGVFDACPGVEEATVLVGSANGKTFDRISVWYGPYVAGSYAEGAYELDFPMTAAMLDAVKPAYRTAFSAAK